MYDGNADKKHIVLRFGVSKHRIRRVQATRIDRDRLTVRRQDHTQTPRPLQQHRIGPSAKGAAPRVSEVQRQPVLSIPNETQHAQRMHLHRQEDPERVHPPEDGRVPVSVRPQSF